MPFVLYVATAVLSLWLVHRYIRAISWPAALVLLVLPLGLTGAALLNGDVYGPVDHLYTDEPLASLASEYGIGTAHNAAVVDVASEFLPWRLAVRESLRRGEWPLWNAYNLAGLPLAASWQAAPYMPFTLIACLLPAAASLTYSAAMALFVAAVSAFLFARELGLGEGPSLFAAIGWGLAASIVLYCHTAMGFTTAFLPFLMTATRRVVYVPGVAAGALLSAALVLTILSGHPESLFTGVLMSCVYGLFELIRRRGSWRAIGTAAGGGIAALLLTAIFLLPLVEAIPQSVEYRLKSAKPFPAKSSAVVLAGVATDFFPHLHVRPWLSPPLSYIDVETAAVGSLVLAFALYAIWRRRSPETWFFAGLTAFGIVAGAGWPPLVNAVRLVPLMQITLTARFAFSAALGLVVLAAYGVDLIVQRREFARAAAMCAAVLLILGGGMFWLSRYALLGDPGYGRGRMVAELLFLGVAVFVMIARLPSRWLVPALLALLYAQRLMSERDTFRTFPAAAAYPPLVVFEPLQSARGLYRVAGMKAAFPPSTNIFYGLEDVRGYEALTFAPYWDTFPLWSGPHGVWFNHVESLQAPFLSFLNVRFAVQSDTYPVPAGWHVVAAANGAHLLENENVVERIFVPQRVALTAMSPEEVVGRMLDAREFRSVAWINTPEVSGVRENGSGSISVRSHSRGGEYLFDASMRSEGWVVISSTAWKGWRATIDGRPAPLHRANAAFLAVLVPRGQHRVRLHYLPGSFVAGAGISLATLAAIVMWGISRRVVRGRASM